MKVELTLPLPTSINALYINQHGWNPKTRTRIPTGKRILSTEGRKVKDQIQRDARTQVKGQDWDYEKTKEVYLYQDAIIYFRRTDQDDNNIYKLLNDSLEDIIYDNDKRVLVRTQRILYDTENPRVELTITPVEYKGIFDTETDLNCFEDKCKTCTRFTRNCSILKKAKEGRVQEDVIDSEYQCSKYKEKK